MRMPSRPPLFPDECRSRVIVAAAEAFAEWSYDELLVGEVAARAEVSAETLSRLFPTKRELFLAVLDSAGERWWLATEPDPALEPTERLRTGLVRYFGFASRNAALFLAVCRIAADDDEIGAIVRSWQSVPEERLYEGLPEPWRTPRTRQMVRSWTGHVLSVCLEWLANPGRSTSEDLAEDCRQHFLDSLARAVESEPPG